MIVGILLLSWFIQIILIIIDSLGDKRELVVSKLTFILWLTPGYLIYYLIKHAILTFVKLPNK